MTEAEREQILHTWNTNVVPADDLHEACIHQLIAAQAQRTPDAVAVVAPPVHAVRALTMNGQGTDGMHGDERSEPPGGKTLTYGELDRRANQLARYLRRRLGAAPVRTPAMNGRGTDGDARSE